MAKGAFAVRRFAGCPQTPPGPLTAFRHSPVLQRLLCRQGAMRRNGSTGCVGWGGYGRQHPANKRTSEPANGGRFRRFAPPHTLGSQFAKPPAHWKEGVFVHPRG